MSFAVASTKGAVFARGTPVRASRPARAQRAPRVVAMAKYGEDSKYFDLNDLENTLGSWDMYGQQAEDRYPGIQAAFFERATMGLSKREAMLGFLAGIGGASILVWGAKGSKDGSLPITKGPSKPAAVGPRGRI